MDHAALTATGTLTWVAAIVVSTMRGCVAGHAPTAALDFLVLTPVTISVWAIAPDYFHLEERPLGALIGWAAALTPLLYLGYQFFMKRRNKKASPATEGEPSS